MKPENSNNIPFVVKALLVFIAVILLPVLIIFGVLYSLWGLVLLIAIWVVWGARGRRILFVYSDSPVWATYIEREILPHIQGKAVILNWSERKMWKPSLAVWAFHYFGGRRNFNPMAIAFRPFRPNKMFRFYEAFQDYKHGKVEKLGKLRMEFLDSVKL